MEVLNFNFGDIIWANRLHYGVAMEESHQEGPYIVIDSDDELVYAVPGKSYSPKRDDYTLRDNFYLERSVSSLKRNTFFNLSKVIKLPYKKVINYIGSINDAEKNEIMKKLIMQQNMDNLIGYDASVFMPLVKFELGDVLEKDGQKYFVLKQKSDNTVKMFPYKYNQKGIPRFNFYKTIATSIDESYKLTYHHTDEFIKSLRFKLFVFECHKPINACEGIRPGSIILYNENIYYINSVENECYVCNKLEIASPERKKQVVRILGFYFQVENCDTPIPRINENVHLLYNLPENRITAIEGLKNSVQSDHVDLILLNKINLFGRIVTAKHRGNTRFALYKVVNNSDGIFVDLEKLSKGIFETEQLSFYQVHKRGSSKTSFKQFILSIKVKVEDPRFEELLVNNGIYGNIDYVNTPKPHTRRRF